MTVQKSDRLPSCHWSYLHLRHQESESDQPRENKSAVGSFSQPFYDSAPRSDHHTAAVKFDIMTSLVAIYFHHMSMHLVRAATNSWSFMCKNHIMKHAAVKENGVGCSLTSVQ